MQLQRILSNIRVASRSLPFIPDNNCLAASFEAKARTEYLLRTLQVKKISFTSYDLASDEEAKRLWRRKAPLQKQQLPGILVGGRFPGTFEDFEEAVEFNELDSFLRLKEEYDPELDGTSYVLPEKAVGVPGASSPSQMTNQKPSFSGSPSPLKDKGSKKNENEVDVGGILDDNSLQGITVTDDELADLVKELGLEGDEAGDLVKGLSFTDKAPATSDDSDKIKSEETQDGIGDNLSENVSGKNEPSLIREQKSPEVQIVG